MKKPNTGSSLPGFYKLTLEERLNVLKEIADLSDNETEMLRRTGSLDTETAGLMIENVVGTMELPFGIATNFIVNGKEMLVPMVLEEPSVVAAASKGAKLARPNGFRASADRSIMKGMVQLVGVADIEKAKHGIEERKAELVEMCRNPNSSLVELGGGVFDICPRALSTKRGEMLIVDILCDCLDAMGANTLNTAAEKLAPILEEMTGGKRRLMIISNLADQRLARAEVVWSKELLGEQLIEGIMDAYEFAEADPYRAATQNKGIMNGIDAVCLATGNDFRALEAGAHAYAARGGCYCSLTKYEKTPEGDLKGTIEIPAAVGIVGGSTKTNVIARIGLKILGVKSARELAGILAAVGLAQNFATLRAQVAEGLQKGHMRLHAKNLAVMAGAVGREIDAVAEGLVSSKEMTASSAKKILEKIRQKNK